MSAPLDAPTDNHLHGRQPDWLWFGSDDYAFFGGTWVKALTPTRFQLVNVEPCPQGPRVRVAVTEGTVDLSGVPLSALRGVFQTYGGTYGTLPYGVRDWDRAYLASLYAEHVNAPMTERGSITYCDQPARAFTDELTDFARIDDALRVVVLRLIQNGGE